MPGNLESVEEFYRLLLEPGLGQPTNAIEHDCRPDGRAAVLSALVRDRLDGPPGFGIQVVDLESGAIRALTGRSDAVERLGRWSPDGERIAFLSDDGGGPVQPFLAPASGAGAAARLPLPGYSVEDLEWFPDGRRLLALAAEEGASAGVLSGSGRVPAAAGEEVAPGWTPLVHRGGEALGGWRRAFVLEGDGAGWRQISDAGLNVWEGCLAGAAVLAVASTQPFEGSWVNSKLVLIPLDGSGVRELYRPQHQLAWPASSSDGAHFAVIEGIASDRGLVAGEVLLLAEGQDPARVDTDGVDATWVGFRDPGHLCVAGVRDTRTVLLEVDLQSGRRQIHLESGMTTSDEFYPRAAIVPGGGLLITAARWDRAPHLALAERGTLRQVLSLSNPGTDWLESQLGRLEEVTWTAPDGLQISGFLAPTRGGSGPQPTVLVVHGGPAWCYRDSWPGLDGANHALLSCCGFQLFFPNPRGSSGRGQGFLARELGDYGGGEVDDLLSGLDHLVKSGAADPDRLGVVGVSHGGYMSCWLTTRTRRFRAAVAVSPVTDWYSQHFGSNIPEFDEMYLRGDPHQPGGPYFERSPVFFAHLSKTPTLLTAGLQDRCTPPGQAEEFHQALLAAGTQSDLVVYPEEGHGVRQLRAKVDLGARMSGHLARHLLKGSPA